MAATEAIPTERFTSVGIQTTAERFVQVAYTRLFGGFSPKAIIDGVPRQIEQTVKFYGPEESLKRWMTSSTFQATKLAKFLAGDGATPEMIKTIETALSEGKSYTEALQRVSG
jgi:hypothetical protein